MLNKFTILIPTRERSETLYHTIRCCLNQTYQNLNIIVSDNFSKDNTKSVVESFIDKRLKYVNTGRRISMSENFDFALSHVTDGYVMFIGDDDGIIPNCLEYINEIINRTQCEAITSYNAFYTWPKTINQNKLFWGGLSGYEVRDSKRWINKYLSFRMPYTFDLPGVYCGFVKIEALNRVTKANFFKSITPDAYSAIAVAFATTQYVYSHTPFVLHGSSARSNGGAYLQAKKEQEGEESVLFFKENTLPIHPDIVMTKAFRVCALEAFLQFSTHFPELTSAYNINWELFLKYVLTEISTNTKDEIENAVAKMCKMHNVDYNLISKNLPNKFSGLTLNELILKVFNKVKFIIKNNKTKIDNTEYYGVYNVYDAALLLNFHLKNRIK